MLENNDARKLSRRETIRRGAAIGGALVWSVPAVHTLTMTAAKAQAASPGAGAGPDISYIALNVVCGGQAFFIKYEVDCECFEDSPGKAPKCEAVFAPQGEKKDGDELGFTADGPHPVSRCIELVVPLECAVTASAVKGGQQCCSGDTGAGALVFCPPTC